MTIKKKEKRDAILYVKVKPSIKKWLQRDYKKLGYSTLSEYVDAVLSNLKSKAK